MSAGTLGRRAAWALKGTLIPLHLRLAEHAHAKVLVTAFSLPQATEWLYVMPLVKY